MSFSVTAMRRAPAAPTSTRLALLLAAALLSGCASQAPRADALPDAAVIDSAPPFQGTPVPGALPTVADPTLGDGAMPVGDTAGVPVDASATGGDIDGQAIASAATPVDERSQAELDYDALYGVPYDPVADPTLPAPAQLPAVYDPWEPFNRRVHAFNNAVDRTVAKPLAQAYVAVVPRPVRLGVGNFFSNLGQPVSAVNAALQGRPAQAGASLGRFVVNSTLGIGGLFDPATRLDIPNRSEDFGQTLGVWGWRNSRYLELPLFGPRTVRDVFGLVGDAPLSPVRQVDNNELRIFLQGLQLVDIRTQLMAIDSLREGATDEYALFRDSWLQRRNYQIMGDRNRAAEGDDPDAGLPDYLREDSAGPTVPVDVMPIVPGGN